MIATADQLGAFIVDLELFSRLEQRLQVFVLHSIVIDKVLELCELVKAVIVEHKRLIHVLLLIKEEKSEAATKQLLGPLVEVVGAILLVCLVQDLYQTFPHGERRYSITHSRGGDRGF